MSVLNKLNRNKVAFYITLPCGVVIYFEHSFQHAAELEAIAIITAQADADYRNLYC